ncbi:hypothetical protein BCT04_05000 [Vibrio breoganii]|uniref:phosphatase PAP2 family protein n=1 Tax=Vibrio breoganii TaxID=553239 RepID=UPI000C831BC5|nr:phosphatase PAP2 family protein [Vibrio breoganii]PMM18497.1 hypothetical protein BCT59_11525 [Vibrio breoganii]PMO69206.1 hypothetical protein BCT04_05000 [Vibrio breoganii]
MINKTIKVLISIHFLLWSAIYLIAVLNDLSSKLVPFLYLSSLFNGMIITFMLHFVCYFIYLAINKSPYPLKCIIDSYKKNIFNKKQITHAVFLVFLVTVNSSIYTSFKGIIPKINEFSYDLPLAHIDRFIHFGIDPWEITHFIFSTPEWSMLISLFYTIWLFAFWWFVCAIIFSSKGFEIKLMIISGFNFTWIINGSILALIFSSAGPCFLEYVVSSTESDFFDGLMGILQEQRLYFESKGYWFGVPATLMQDILWAAYLEDRTEIGAGISAFPSMHVSICMYMWLVTKEYFKVFSNGLLIFLIIIFLGSVHLGWHYAIDGYVSIITTLIIWFFTKKIFGRSVSCDKGKFCSENKLW